MPRKAAPVKVELPEKVETAEEAIAVLDALPAFGSKSDLGTVKKMLQAEKKEPPATKHQFRQKLEGVRALIAADETHDLGLHEGVLFDNDMSQCPHCHAIVLVDREIAALGVL